MTRGRFAATPSGDLDLGDTRTAILAWLHARAAGGKIVLRFDNLDPERCREHYEFRQIEDLAWLGLTWDGEIERQSQHIGLYTDALQRLREQGLVYPCFCPHGERDSAYPGTCRALPPAQAMERIARGDHHGLRLAVPAGSERFHDFVHGDVTIDVARSAGDLVLLHATGAIGYDLACAVDDALPGITHVVRGNDRLASAASQRMIMHLLDLEPPAYGHVPQLFDGSSVLLRDQRELGVSPEELVGRLAGMFSIGDGAPSGIEDLVPFAAGLAG